MNKLIIVTLLMLSFCGAAHAGPIFGFTFSNANGDEVNGRIFGLLDNTANQAASSILIDSFTGQTDGVFGTATSDVVTWNNVFNNAFSVLDGQIVQSIFAAQDRDASLGTFCINRNGCIGHTNILQMQGAGVGIGNGEGFNGVLFSNITSVSEPATASLLALGMVGLAVRRRARHTN